MIGFARGLIGAICRRYPVLKPDDAAEIAGAFVRQLPEAITNGTPIAWMERTEDGSVRVRMWKLEEVR